MILPGLPHVLSLLWTFCLGRRYWKVSVYFFCPSWGEPLELWGKPSALLSSKRDHPTFTLNKTSWFIQGALECLTERPDYFITCYSELFGLFPFRNAHFSGIILIRNTVDASSVFPSTTGLLWTHCFYEFHNTSTEVGYYCCFPEKHLLLLYWLCQSLWLCGSQQTVENFSRDMNTRPPYLPPEKSAVRSRSNS